MGESTARASTRTQAPGKSAPKYVAFISYSHADSKVGRWLHRGIEGYRVPKRLQRDHGAPKRLQPVFRDRDELPAGGDLPQHLRAALERSDHLIILGSTHAAASHWVGQEIAFFKALGKGAAIIPVIAEDGPGTAFPPVLQRVVAPDGTVTEAPDPIHYLSADLRPEKDGRREGLLKVIAGLLGIDFGEVKARELEAARRRTMVTGVIAAAFALLAVFAGYTAFEENRQRGLAEALLSKVVGGVSDIVDQVGVGAERGEVTTALTRTLLSTADEMIRDVGIGTDAAPQLKLQQARLQQQFARYYRRVGEGGKAHDAALRAKKLVEELAQHPDYQGSWAQHTKALALADLADVRLAQGAVDDALAAYDEGLQIARELAKRDPNNLGYQRDVAVSLERLGAIARRRGQNEVARKHWEQEVQVAKQAQSRDPTNAGWPRFIAVVHLMIADLEEPDAHQHRTIACDLLDALAQEGKLLPRDQGMYEKLKRQLGR